MDTTNQSPVIISLCTGIRGLERGLERALQRELTIAAYVEIETFIDGNLIAGMEAGVLAPAPVWTDLKTFPFGKFHGKIHGIIGGYPCQPFSVAGSKKEQKTQDTYGLSLKKEYHQLDLFSASLKTSEDTLSSDLKRSIMTFENLVTKCVSEYTVRRKSVRHIEEKDSLSSQSWQTIQARDFRSPDLPESGNYQRKKERGFTIDLKSQVMNWGTPRVTTNGGNGAIKENTASRLEDQAVSWPTPTAESCQNVPENALLGRAVHTRGGQQDQESNNTNGKSREQLNPAWALQLMGTTLEKTFFVPLVTEWSNKLQN